MALYRRHFGLTGDPFHVTPDFSMLLLTKSHREALGAIEYGLRDRKGFIVVTGEVGTGKTTVLRACLDTLPPDETIVIYIFEPRLGTQELYASILADIADRKRSAHVRSEAADGALRDAVDARPAAPRGSAEPGPAVTRPAAEPLASGSALRQIQQHLLDAYADGRLVILAVDEAQHMSPETLESLRMLSNLETARDKLLQIVLVGQPELDEILRRHDLRQVEQRIAVRAHLSALSVRESMRYVRHRLSMAGWRGDEDLFTRPALWLIARRGRGIPRSINILCDNAMVNAFGAGIDGQNPRIGVWTVLRSRSRPKVRRASWPSARLVVIAAVLLAAAGTWQMASRGWLSLPHWRAPARPLPHAAPLAAIPRNLPSTFIFRGVGTAPAAAPAPKAPVAAGIAPPPAAPVVAPPIVAPAAVSVAATAGPPIVLRVGVPAARLFSAPGSASVGAHIAAAVANPPAPPAAGPVVPSIAAPGAASAVVPVARPISAPVRANVAAQIPASVSKALAPGSAAPLAIVILYGDTLREICFRAYGQCSTNTLEALIKANQLQNPDALSVGQVIVVPPDLGR